MDGFEGITPTGEAPRDLRSKRAGGGKRRGDA
jgi:hypothetical protein